jgi:hypothetical protein
MAYAFNTESLYDKTDNGLEILKHYLGHCEGFDKALQNDKNAFKFRDKDATASAYLVKNSKAIKSGLVNYWRVKDFGGSFFTPIGLAMEQSGLDFHPCLKMLYELFKLDGANSEFFKPTVEIKTLDDTDKRTLDWFKVVTKEKIEHLDIIGTFVTEDIAKDYNFFEIDYYEKVFINKKTGLKNHIKVTATDSFPIFCYMPNDKWCKTYAPLSKDKNYKHGYLGTKPTRYVHGLQRFLDSVDTNEIDSLTIQIKECEDDKTKKYLIEQREELKAKEIIICSGGSDGLNVVSLGYDCIWFNSEGEQISFDEYQLLLKYSKAIYNLPDVDKEGVKYGYEVAENFWNMKSIWLPKEKLGTNGKDFRDWMKFYKKSDLKSVQFQFANLITGALKMKFFERNSKTNALKIKPSYLHYFLKVKGFYLYYPDKTFINKSSEQEFIFIRIINNIVDQHFANTIRKFCEKYLIEKGQPVEVIDIIKSTTAFTDKNLMSLDPITLDFSTFDAETQIFFFKNQFATVTASGIELKPYKDCKTFVWSDKIINRNIFLDKPFFSVAKDENGVDKLTINNQECEYMNFLINTSRTYWRKELETQFEGKPIEEKKEYHNTHRFEISSTYLTDEENQIQQQHLLSKFFAIGYMLHKYKRQSFARMVYIMDDLEKELEEERNGGSGKSMILKGIDCLFPKRVIIDGMQSNLLTNPFILGEVTKETDYILLEDLAQHYSIEPYYNWITGSLNVRPIYKQGFELSFFDAPKIALTRNYGLKGNIKATLRRILFLSTSDYYHVISDQYNEERRVYHDFGHDLFLWDEKNPQPSIHFNFLMQCLQYYLQKRDAEVLAPQTNINRNNLAASFGDAFKDWAEGYFSETETITDDLGEIQIVKGTLNEYVLREDMQKSYSLSAGKFSKTAPKFKASLKDYCKNEGWLFNPTDLQGSDGLIKKPTIDEKGKRQIKEHFFIKTNFLEAEPTPEPAPETTEVTPSDDLPF